ncbi:fibrinogen-related protein 3.1 [Elysia marginata]|uniref:Fibrinogen-related protein 3.1 n=1 Tax=Elysia marginata TaxID=1093978 RepID=A0AAV4HP22_9GAST|nr:fibrinogen-related protein 3.1 [Elysia marginata]
MRRSYNDFVFTGLEMNLVVDAPASPWQRKPCGVLTCKEISNSGDSSGDIAGMSIFKTPKSSLVDGDGPKHSSLVAALSLQMPNVMRVSDAMKVSGSLKTGEAILRVEMVKDVDCLAQYTCEVRTLDTEGIQRVHTNRIQQAVKSPSKTLSDNRVERAGGSLQTFLLLQQFDTKLALLGTSLEGRFTALENRLEDKILSVQDGMNGLKSELDSKIESRVVDKICELDTKLSSYAETKDVDVKSQIKAAIDADLERYRQELIYRGNLTLASCLDSSKELARQLNKSILLSSSVRKHLTDVLISEQKSEDKLKNLTQSIDQILTSSHGLYKHIDNVCDRLESNANNRSIKTLSSVNELFFTINATIKSALQTPKEDNESPQQCSEGIGSLATSSAFPYPVIRLSVTIGLTTPILCDTTTDGGGWIIIQRRTSGNVDFYRGWNEYKKGFGSLEDDFWLGNENIHLLSSSGKFELRIELRLESNASNRSTNTLSSVNELFFTINATIKSALQTPKGDNALPQQCSKGMGSLATSSAFPYPIIRLSVTIGLTTPILCDTTTDGGGWIIIQRRTSGNVDFYRGWSEYRKGFGSLGDDFWLGNENIHLLSSSGKFELRIELRYQNKSAFARYSSFSVDSEKDNYVLRLGDYEGTAGDSLGVHNGHKFSTFDKDNDRHRGNCAVDYTGAWWYTRCHGSNLNGKWAARANKGPRWLTFTKDEPVSFSEMKIRRV